MADTHTFNEVIKVTIDSKDAEKSLSNVEKKSKSVLQQIDILKKPISIVMTVKDKATAVLNKVGGLVKKLTGKVHEVILQAIDKVTPVVEAIGSTISSVVNTAATATAVATTAIAGLGVSSFQAAAEVGEMNATLGALAKANNLSTEAVNDAVLATKNMGIEMATAQGTVAKMIQSDLDLAQASKLARVAQDAAVIGQVNSTEALDRLIHGITTQQTDVLRGIGINVDAATAQEKYAKSVKKTASELTAAEKSAAMMNAVLEEGSKIAGTYEAAMEEPGKVLRSFPRLFKSIQVAIGETLLDAFGPFILALYNMVKALDAALQKGQPLNFILLAIGDAFTRLMKPITEATKRMTDWIKAIDIEQVKGFVEQMRKLAPALLPIGAALAAIGGANLKGVLGPLGMLIPTINPIVAAFGALLVMLPNLRKNVLDLGSALFQAFTKDAGAMGVVYDLMTEMFGPEIANAMQPLLQNMMEFLQVVRDTGGWVEFLKLKFADLKVALEPVIDRLQILAVNILGTLSKALPSLGRSVHNVATAFKDLVGPVLDSITTFNGWEDVEKKIMKVVNIIELLSLALVKLAGWVHENSDAVKKFLKVLAMIDIGMKLSKPIMAAVKIIGILVKVFGKIGPMFAKIGGIVSKLGPLFAKLGGIISKVLIPAIKGVATVFLAWPGPIKIVITLVFGLIALFIRLWRTNEDFRNAVIDIWNNISEVIGNAVEAIKSKLGEWMGYLKRTWEEAGGELGPFLLLLGQDLIQNLKDGIVNGIPMILEAIAGMREAILEKITELIQDAHRWGMEMLGKLVEGIQSKLPDVTAAIDSVKETISTAIQSIITQALDWGRSIVQGIADGITGGLGAIASAAGQIGSTISSSVSGAVSGAMSAVTTGGAVASAVPGGRSGTAEVVPAGVADTGALLPTGYAAINKSGRDEVVLPPGRNPVTVNLGGLTVNASGTSDPTALAEAVARALAPRLQQALSNMV